MKSLRLSLPAVCLGAMPLLAGCGPGDPGEHSPEGGAAMDSQGLQGTCSAEYGVLDSGSHFATEQGNFEFEFDSLDPERPDLGDNTWEFSLRDDAGVALSGASVTFSPWMPEHGHGSLKTVVVKDLGDGHYRATPVNFHMPGRWDITVTIEMGNVSDHLTFTACVAS